MNKTITSLLIAFLIIACSSSKTLVSKSDKDTCKSLRTGKFIIEDATINHTSVIIRNDSIQYEKDIERGQEMRFKIEWIDDCKYSLSPINPGDDIPDIMKKVKLIVEIDSVRNNVQYFSSYLDGFEDSKRKGAIKKLE